MAEQPTRSLLQRLEFEQPISGFPNLHVIVSSGQIKVSRVAEPS